MIKMNLSHYSFDFKLCFHFLMATINTIFEKSRLKKHIIVTQLKPNFMVSISLVESGQTKEK